MIMPRGHHDTIAPKREKRAAMRNHEAWPRPEDRELVQGFADGYLKCDLNARFITNRTATYLPPAPDDGIEGIHLGDTLIVDRSIKPQPGLVIVAELDGQYCLRRIIRERGRLMLIDDKGYVPPRMISGIEYYHGTVTHNIHPSALIHTTIYAKSGKINCSHLLIK